MTPKGKFRITRQRQVILEELRKVVSHPTADEVCQLVRQKLPHISLGTVYRNLELLAEYGLVQKIELAGSQRRFDGNVENHYHIHCKHCGRVDDLPIRPFPVKEDDLRSVTAFQVTGHRVEFFGLCPACKNESELAALPD
ncbi:MAG: transcriptional repressor [Candidatus Sumerlaeia bacterium]|nr:transcriptional repressor [Candidatus Sumerlaeia bacterium]